MMRQPDDDDDDDEDEDESSENEIPQSICSVSTRCTKHFDFLKTTANTPRIPTATAESCSGVRRNTMFFCVLLTA